MKTTHSKPKHRRINGHDHRRGALATYYVEDATVWPAWFKRMGKKLARVRWLE